MNRLFQLIDMLIQTREQLKTETVHGKKLQHLAKTKNIATELEIEADLQYDRTTRKDNA